VSGSSWQLLVVVLTGAVITEAIVLVGLLRQVGTLLLQFQPPRPGVVEGQGPNPGTVIDPATGFGGRPEMAVFLSPTCTLCPPIASALPGLRRNYPELRVTALVVGDDADQVGEYVLAVGGQLDRAALYSEWNVPGTPFAVGMAEGKIVHAGVVNSLPQLETLADSVLRSADNPTLTEQATSTADAEVPNAVV
jgi:hypothetical protein